MCFRALRRHTEPAVPFKQFCGGRLVATVWANKQGSLVFSEIFLVMVPSSCFLEFTILEVRMGMYS